MAMQHIQDATFELPEGLMDRTVHMFALSDTGPSAFNLVMHRADGIEEETIDAFADRLANELSRGLAKFDLKDRLPCEVDGCPAIELSYSFRQEGQFLHQRQVVVFVTGANSDLPTALLVTGTCPGAFGPEWNEAFDTMLKTVKLREPWEKPAAQAAPSATTLPINSIGPVRWPVFGVHGDLLHVLEDQSAVESEVNTADVAWGRWAFFDFQGQPLEPRVHSNDPSKPFAADRFDLHRVETSKRKHLLSVVNDIVTLRPNPHLATLMDVRRHLDKHTAQRPQGA